MNKLQKIISKHRRSRIFNPFRKHKIRGYKKLLIISIMSLILIFLYLSITITNVSSARLDLFSLKQDYLNYTTCHENCLINRSGLRDEVVSNINTDTKMVSDWKKYWEESVENKQYAWQKELLTLIYHSDNKEEIDLYLVDYLISDSVDKETKVNIINLYLSTLNDSSFVPYYIYLIGEEDKSLKIAAIRALSNLKEKEKILSDSHLKTIKDSILDESELKVIKIDLFFLLTDLYLIKSEEVSTIVKEIYENINDEGLKYLAADFLTAKGFTDYSSTEIPDVDWNAYLN